MTEQWQNQVEDEWQVLVVKLGNDIDALKQSFHGEMQQITTQLSEQLHALAYELKHKLNVETYVRNHYKTLMVGTFICGICIGARITLKSMNPYLRGALMAMQLVNLAQQQRFNVKT